VGNDEVGISAAIDQDGWLQTGDLCPMDSCGCLTIAGRLKEMIIRDGENNHATELEESSLRQPQVIEVAVLGVPDEKLGEVVAAVVSADFGDPPAGLLYERTAPNISRLTKGAAVGYGIGSAPLAGLGETGTLQLNKTISTRELSNLCDSRRPPRSWLQGKLGFELHQDRNLPSTDVAGGINSPVLSTQTPGFSALSNTAMTILTKELS
jgi:hypothetical protein